MQIIEYHRAYRFCKAHFQYSYLNKLFRFYLNKNTNNKLREIDLHYNLYNDRANFEISFILIE